MSTNIKQLRDSLESIIFQEKNLKPVIKAITTLNPDKSDSEKVIELIIRSRFHMLEKLITFFSFHVEHEIKLWNIDNFSYESSNLKLEKELKEKNAFLEEIAQKVEDIYEKLVKV
ncbi:MAG: hypothetical protein ACFFAH_10410 [Promethearchaeota archaeon]